MDQIEQELMNFLPYISKLLDLSIGIFSLGLIKSKIDQRNDNQLIYNLIKELEEKNIEIARLKLEIATWKKHHERLSKAKRT